MAEIHILVFLWQRDIGGQSVGRRYSDKYVWFIRLNNVLAYTYTWRNLIVHEKNFLIFKYIYCKKMIHILQYALIIFLWSKQDYIVLIGNRLQSTDNIEDGMLHQNWSQWLFLTVDFKERDMLHRNNSFKRICCIFVRKKMVWLNMNKDNIFMINFYSKIK